MHRPPDAIVVDGSYLLHRTYHAVPRSFSRSNILVNAVKGIIRAVLGMYNYYHPEVLTVVFDSKEPSFRHLLSADYKAHRPEYPAELSAQIAMAVGLLHAFGFPVVIRPGFEGDDIIGTLAQMCAQKYEVVYIATADKDMLQLVNDNIKVYDPYKRHVFGEVEVFSKLGVYPKQVADYLAMVGDKADGIKGMPGCGPVLAAMLLTEFGELSNITSSVDTLPGNAKKIVSRGLESIDLDRKLTGIVTDLDLGVTVSDLQVTDVNDDLVSDLCTEYNIETL